MKDFVLKTLMIGILLLRVSAWNPFFRPIKTGKSLHQTKASARTERSIASASYRAIQVLQTSHRSIGTQLSRERGTRTALFLRGGTATCPPVQTWIAPALVCALSYALYNINIKKASTTIDPILGGVLLQFVAALIGSLLLLGKRVAGATFTVQPAGLWWSVAAGVAVGAAELLSFYVSSKGVQAMQSIPIIIGGSILFGTALGSLWLKESITARGWIGVGLIFLGILFVGTDPGASFH